MLELMTLAFTITTHRHLTGVRLSLSNNWGNIPFPDEEAALAHAKKVSGVDPFTIERSTWPALPAYTGCNHEHL